MTGITAAFRAFGAKGKKTRWSWSAQTPDGRVVMSFWKDQFLPGQPLSYSDVGRSVAAWQDQLGNQERIENLRRARDHWGGLMGVVIVTDVDEDAHSRTIAEAFPRKNLLMRITELNAETGEFSSVNVGKLDQLMSRLAAR